ncbi:MAG: BON domain-containing protein [Pseudomonadota bacterium]|nr:BON domain-containing protein [Pseudomonadota bacterium]
MNTKLIAASFLVIGSLVAPIAVRAEDGDSDRAHPSAFVKDSVITTKVKAALAKDKVRSLTHIHVDTDRNGMVVLSGSAKTQQDVDAAASIAKAVEGVTSVQNNIQIKKDL